VQAARGGPPNGFTRRRHRAPARGWATDVEALRRRRRNRRRELETSTARFHRASHSRRLMAQISSGPSGWSPLTSFLRDVPRGMSTTRWDEHEALVAALAESRRPTMARHISPKRQRAGTRDGSLADWPGSRPAISSRGLDLVRSRPRTWSTRHIPSPPLKRGFARLGQRLCCLPGGFGAGRCWEWGGGTSPRLQIRAIPNGAPGKRNAEMTH